MSKIIEVVSYDPLWPKLFQEEAMLIKKALQENIIELHHIGSTSVPSLAAKPIIDIIATVKNLEKIIVLLRAQGYSYHGAYNLPFRYFFRKYGSVNIHLHIYPEDYRPEVELNLAFRDYLRTHSEAASAYERLKHTLLSDSHHLQKNRSLFSAYTLGKDSFIREILSKTGFNNIRITCCNHEYEWQATEKFRTNYHLALDDFIDTYANPEHIHLALYQGVTVVGYLHVELLPEGTFTFHTFAVEETHEKVREEFLKLCTRWLNKNREVLQAQL